MEISQDQTKLQAVEVNDQSSGDFRGSFFLDLATHDTLKKLFQIYLLFLIIHFIGSCIAPQNFERSSKIYSINYDPTIKYVEVDVTLTNLQPKNRLVTAYGEILRRNIQDDETLLLNITSRSMYNFHFVIVNLTDPVNYDVVVNFAKNDRSSSSFLIFNNTVNNYDLVQTRLNIGGDFGNIDGFNFSWASINPNPERFLNFAKLSFLLFNFYILIFFVPLRKFKVEALTQKMLVVLLFFALFTSIPITFIIYNQAAYLLECLSTSAFIAVFRIFCITQVYISNNDELKSQKKFITNLIIIFVFSSIIDSFAHFLRILEKEKPQDLQYSFLTIELLNSAVNFAISVSTIIYCVSSYRSNQNSNLPRLSITSSLLVASSIITIITEIIALILKLRILYIWPEMMFLLYHLGTVTLLAFLFRPADSLQYEDIRLNEKQNLNHMSTNSVDLFGDE